jgi:hypothetical protein
MRAVITTMKRIRILILISIVTAAICILAFVDVMILFSQDMYHFLPWDNRRYEFFLSIIFIILPLLISISTGIWAFVLSFNLMPIPKAIIQFSYLVSPFIAFFVLWALPGLLSGRMSIHESLAVTSLKHLCAVEANWKQQDIDGNGIKDYWTYDVSCLNRMYRSDNKIKVNYIKISLARSDSNRAVDNIFGMTPSIESWSDGSFTPTYGYYFQAMKLDENGNPYNQNEVSENKIKATNSSKFAFIAYPTTYGSSGVNIFIVNEQGTIYSTDPGADANKIVLQWPGPKPESVKGPGGRQWVAQE